MRLEQIGADRLNEMDNMSSLAFTYRRGEPGPDFDPAAQISRELAEGHERWGMIDDETGRMMGGMQLISYRTRIGETWQPLIGIGGVTTLPEYRRSGVIRRLFEYLLPRMYEQGVTVSGLYPFLHAFYRKFGYETFGGRIRATVNLDQLRCFPQPDKVRMIESDRDMLAARALYEQFTVGRELTMRRDIDKQWTSVMGGEPYKDLVYKYLLLREGADGLEPCAYIKFSPDESVKDCRVASAREAAYKDADALRRLLGFMSTFNPHYRKLSLTLPGDIDLATMCADPYKVEYETDMSYMVRAVNARALLMAQPLSPALRMAAAAQPLSFSIALTDAQIPQNTGRYAVTITPEGVTCDQGPLAPADMEMDITTFSQLATGTIALAQAACRADFRLNNPCPAAEALFVRRPQYIVDQF